MKLCKKCNIFKDLEQFHKRSSSRDGYRTECKECVAEFNRKRYAVKGEEIRKRVLAQYHEIGKEEMTSRRRSYSEQYYIKNREKMLAASAARDKANPEARKGRKSRHRARTLIAMSKLDRKKSTLWRKKIKDNPCYYCGKITEQMHDDHYYPLAKGGTDYWFNIVRACQVCNQKKNARLASAL